MRSGFTLLELVVVVIVMGVTFAVAIPALPGPDEASPLDLAVQNAVALLRSAQRNALRGGQPVDVVIDPASGRYWIRTERGEEARSGHLDTPTGATYRSDRPRVHFHFWPDGRALADSLTVVADGRAVGVFLEPWTGHVARSR